MNEPLELYTHTLSANGRKVIVLASLLELNIKIKLTNVYQGEGQEPEFIKINSLGQIPTLVDHENEIILSESNAILIYLSEALGNGKFYAKDHKQKAKIHQWLFWEASQWQPACSKVLEQSVGHKLIPNLVPAPLQSPDWKSPLMKRQLNYIDSHLNENAYLLGGSFTIADLSIAGMMTYFHHAGFPFIDYSSLHRWYQKIESMPAWKQTEDQLWKNESPVTLDDHS